MIATLRIQGGVRDAAAARRGEPGPRSRLAAGVGDRVVLAGGGGRSRPGDAAAAPPTATRRRPARPSWSWRSSGCASRSASTTTSASSTAASAATRCSGRCSAACRTSGRGAGPGPGRRSRAAVVKQLIEAERAVAIQRRIVGRWGPRLGDGRGALRDVPAPAAIAGRAPAELASMDLAPTRARRPAAGGQGHRRRPLRLDSPAADRRLLAIPEIGPWTVQCLGLFGRGEPDSLPAGDLAYMKLVGRLAGLGRRASVAEVEEFYAPYEPYRGLAGSLTLAGCTARGPGTPAAPCRLSEPRTAAGVRAWTSVDQASRRSSITTRCG